MQFPHNLVAIDIETTDSNSKTGSIIQLAAVVVNKDFELVQAREFNTFVKPLDFYRNPKAMAVNQISEENLVNAPLLSEVLVMFESFCDKDNILSSWGAYFDIPFLKTQYDKIYRKFPFSHRSFDLKSVAIWELAKREVPVTSGVSRFLEMIGKEFKGQQHNALDDIKNSVEILKHLKNN